MTCYKSGHLRFVAALTYYGLTLNVGSLAGSIYVNLTIAGVLELLAYVLSQFIISSPLGRRVTTASLCVLAGLCLMFTLAVPTGKKINVKKFFLQTPAYLPLSHMYDDTMYNSLLFVFLLEQHSEACLYSRLG